ncbi:molybdate ABC transporter permease subunit, partial [Pseudomonas sp. MWU13-2860]
MSTSEWAAIALTLKLAAISTLILLLLCIPLGWWLSRTLSGFKPMIEAGATLPRVLPPPVLGFYLLVAFGPHGPIGQLTVWLGWPGLAFTFQGLIIASVLYSLPFVLQPLIVSFNAVRREEIETAMVL